MTEVVNHSGGRIAVIDDDPDTCELLEAGLAARGFDVDTFNSARVALDHLACEEFDTVLTDLRLSGTDGIAVCERVRSSRPDLPVVLLTGFGTMDAAVSALRAGAYDFITKPVDFDTLDLSLKRAIQHRSLSREVRRLREAAAAEGLDQEILTESPEMRRVLAFLERVAGADASVLITGETGTGKDLVARALHMRSRRSKGRLVTVNCAAMPHHILESELFGHRKGAFTDARSDRAGLILQADGGTLFLDEIGEMPPQLQVKLLRALEARTIRPVGSDEEVPFDARIITATHVDLEQAVKRGRFREDLYFRLNVIRAELPPLRKRGNDALLLAQHFIRRFAERAGKHVTGMTGAVAEKLLAYGWPGNVRELQNCIERAVALTAFERLTVDDLPQAVARARVLPVVASGEGWGDAGDDGQGGEHDTPLTLDELERRHIVRVLRSVDGNKARAARLLGIDRRTLYRKLDRYEAEGSREASAA